MIRFWVMSQKVYKQDHNWSTLQIQHSSLNLNQRRLMKPSLMSFGYFPWLKNGINSQEMMYGILYLDRKIRTSLVQDGSLETNLTNQVMSFITRQDLLHKATIKRRYWFRWIFCSCCALGIYPDDFGLCKSYGLQALSNGCEKCISEWLYFWRYFCITTPWFWKWKISRSCFQT